MFIHYCYTSSCKIHHTWWLLSAFLTCKYSCINGECKAILPLVRIQTSNPLEDLKSCTLFLVSLYCLNIFCFVVAWKFLLSVFQYQMPIRCTAYRFNVKFGKPALGLLVLCTAYLSKNIRGIMAWRSSGSSNANLVDNLHSMYDTSTWYSFQFHILFFFAGSLIEAGHYFYKMYGCGRMHH